MLSLDDLWTASVEALDPHDQAAIESQRDELSELVDAMDTALVELGDKLPELRMVLDASTGEQVDEAVDRLEADRPDLALAMRELLHEHVVEVGVRGITLFACDFLLEECAAERDELRSKLQRLLAGGEPAADLRPPFRCALTLAKLGAAIAVVVATHGGAVLAAAMVVPASDALLKWNESGCSESWQIITRGRL